MAYISLGIISTLGINLDRRYLEGQSAMSRGVGVDEQTTSISSLEQWKFPL